MKINYKNLDYSSRDVFNFIFLEKGPRIASPTYFEILVNMCIAIVFLPGCDVINFEIHLIFLKARFVTLPKNQYKNSNISRTKRAFKRL